jgi:serine kinase of HPr protein (carbohydrate metabolism regulator)
MPTQILHATAIAIGRSAALLSGASGSGKSDLALRLVDEGARLVADDQTILTVSGNRLLASAPAILLGKIELRGLGIVKLPGAKVTQKAPIGLLVELVAADQIERMPEPARREILGIALPVLRLAPFEASAPAKLRLALDSPAAG